MTPAEQRLKKKVNRLIFKTWSAINELSRNLENCSDYDRMAFDALKRHPAVEFGLEDEARRRKAPKKVVAPFADCRACGGTGKRWFPDMRDSRNGSTCRECRKRAKEMGAKLLNDLPADLRLKLMRRRKSLRTPVPS